MAKPNSVLTRFRWWLGRKIQPGPDPGEGWCWGCVMNEGRTLVIPADSIGVHSAKHNDDAPDTHTVIIAAWPSKKHMAKRKKKR